MDHMVKAIYVGNKLLQKYFCLWIVGKTNVNESACTAFTGDEAGVLSIQRTVDNLTQWSNFEEELDGKCCILSYEVNKESLVRIQHRVI